jgi:hypothetical protein
MNECVDDSDLCSCDNLGTNRIVVLLQFKEYFVFSLTKHNNVVYVSLRARK